MISILLWVIIFIIALLALIKGSYWFTDASESIGSWLGMSPFIIGVTIVSIGTSIPELATSIVAVLTNNSNIVLGNIVGSNIANTLFVLGIGAIIAGTLKTKYLSKELLIVTFSSFLLWLFAINNINLLESIILFLLFIVYVFYVFKDKKKVNKNHNLTWKDPLLLIIGLFLLIIGAKYVVKSSVVIASSLGISSAIIGATAIAFGTSLPEAFVTITSCLRGKKTIGIGNVIGSNIFNIFAITGISGFFGRLIIDRSIFYIAFPTLVISTLILWFINRDNKISRKEGVFMLLLYVLYIYFLFL